MVVLAAVVEGGSREKYSFARGSCATLARESILDRLWEVSYIFLVTSKKTKHRQNRRLRVSAARAFFVVLGESR